MLLFNVQLSERELDVILAEGSQCLALFQSVADKEQIERICTGPNCGNKFIVTSTSTNYYTSLCMDCVKKITDVHHVGIDADDCNNTGTIDDNNYENRDKGKKS